MSVQVYEGNGPLPIGTATLTVHWRAKDHAFIKPAGGHVQKVWLHLIGLEPDTDDNIRKIQKYLETVNQNFLPTKMKIHINRRLTDLGEEPVAVHVVQEALPEHNRAIHFPIDALGYRLLVTDTRPWGRV